MTHRQTWDLEAIFPGGITSPAFAEAAANLGRLLEQLQTATAGLPDPLTPEAIDRWADLFALKEEISRQGFQIHDFLQCLQAQDVHDTEAIAWQRKLAPLSAGIGAEQVKLNERIKQLPDHVWERLLADKRFRPIAYPLRQLRLQMAHRLPQEQEALISDLSADGLTAWWHLYRTVTGKLTIVHGDEPLSLGQANTRMADPDPTARKALHEARAHALSQQADQLAAALNHLSGFRLTLQRHRGEEDHLAEPLRRDRLSRASLEAMWAAVTEATPRLSAYLDRKARLLGQGKLNWYDDQAPLASSPPQPTFGEAAELIVTQFTQFSPRLGDFAARAFSDGWLDVEDRPGKAAGGFCTVFPHQEQSRIFLSAYGGRLMGPSAVAHELGHAFHYHVTRGQSMLLRQAPFAQSEAAAIFSEQILVRPLLERVTDPAHRIAHLDDRLQSAVGYLMGIRCRFLFETRLYTERKQGPLSAQRLNGLMLEAQQEAYGGALATWYPELWMQVGHFFAPTAFYNFPYTFGYLFGLGLYALAQAEEGRFEQPYIALLRDAGRMSAEDLAYHHLAADLTQPGFWRSALQIILADVEAFLSLTE